MEKIDVNVLLQNLKDSYTVLQQQKYIIEELQKTIITVNDLVDNASETDINLSSIRLEINNINSEITSILGNISTIENDLSSLTDTVYTINTTTIPAMNTRITNLVRDVNQNITRLEGEISDINDLITQITTQFSEGIVALDGRTTTLENKVSSLESAMSTVQSDIASVNTAITGIQQNITSLQSGITALVGIVANKQDVLHVLHLNGTSGTLTAEEYALLGDEFSIITRGSINNHYTKVYEDSGEKCYRFIDSESNSSIESKFIYIDKSDYSWYIDTFTLSSGSSENWITTYTNTNLSTNVTTADLPFDITLYKKARLSYIIRTSSSTNYVILTKEFDFTNININASFNMPAGSIIEMVGSTNSMYSRRITVNNDVIQGSRYNFVISQCYVGLGTTTPVSDYIIPLKLEGLPR